MNSTQPQPLFSSIQRPHVADAHDTSRMGTRFTDEDHELIISKVREGAQGPELARALKRTQASVEQRARKLLPPGQRRCPIDRVLPTLAAAVTEPDYDWRTVVALDDPKPPVNEIVRVGISGLSDEELVECAHAVAVTLPRGEQFESLRDEVNQRGLGYQLARRHVLHRQLVEAPHGDQHDGISSSWCEAMGFSDARSYGYMSGRDRGYPW